MISKEEKEKALERIDKRLTIEKYTKNIAIPVYISDLKIILEYIEQLESDKENTIRKLENKIKENKERINPYQNKSNLKKIEKDYIENILIKIEVLQECLKIMKGENNE